MKLITLLLLVSLTFSLLQELKYLDENSTVSAATNLAHVNFQPTNIDIANPERGFMKQSSIYLDQSFDPSKIRAKELTDTIVWVYFRLDNYRDPRDGVGVTLTDYQLKPLEPVGSGRGLDIVKKTFDEARNKGMKLVIRFIYNWGPGSTNDPDQASPDVPLNVALYHINQLKPLFQDYSDIILVGQAGFVGHWGEWHSSKYLYTPESREAIINAMLDALPQERMLQLRYPRFKEIFFGGPLIQSTAYNGTDISRLAHHNDCFLEGSKDGNTYTSRTYQPPHPTSNYCDGQNEITCWKTYVAQEGLFTPVGGESCQYNPPRTDCPNALDELEYLHWSFINNGFKPEVLNSWIAQGCMSEIRRRLGYRYVLDNLDISSQVNPGGNLEFNLHLHNEGFASNFNERPVFVILENKSNGSKMVLPLSSSVNLNSTDPRLWHSGQTVLINENITIPSSMVSGTYNVYLWLPDHYQSLRNNPNYSIRFANSGVWQQNTGYNLLFGNLLIGGTPISPQPSPTATPTGNSCTPTNGDANGDGKATPNDFPFWSYYFDPFNTISGGPSVGDFNCDGFTNANDFSIWSFYFTPF